MKVRIEISEDGDEEVVIRARSLSDEVRRISEAVTAAAGGEATLSLTDGESEYFIPVASLLFFETDGGHTTAHTADRMYYTARKLYELEAILPRTFARVSKSCVVNTALISSIKRNPVGASETLFVGSYKKAYISRSYYKAVRELIEETRIKR
ncbi:MAG: LytTR family transcriptional regulator DNA-binding domain-containing protein [Clostridia bacterium]|nr:LytTR family transcriptional regulator DNA-binding domain-containing protein [Clostridia bacterium]